MNSIEDLNNRASGNITYAREAEYDFSFGANNFSTTSNVLITDDPMPAVSWQPLQLIEITTLDNSVYDIEFIFATAAGNIGRLANVEYRGDDARIYITEESGTWTIHGVRDVDRYSEFWSNAWVTTTAGNTDPFEFVVGVSAPSGETLSRTNFVEFVPFLDEIDPEQDIYYLANLATSTWLNTSINTADAIIDSTDQFTFSITLGNAAGNGSGQFNEGVKTLPVGATAVADWYHPTLLAANSQPSVTGNAAVIGELLANLTIRGTSDITANVTVTLTNANSEVELGSQEILLNNLPNEIGSSFGGGYYAGLVDYDAGNVGTHVLILSDKYVSGANLLQREDDEYSNANITITDDLGQSPIDGAFNTERQATVYSIRLPQLVYNGNFLGYTAGNMENYEDWYIPAVLEFDIIYHNLKPTTDLNATGDAAPFTVNDVTGLGYPSGNILIGYDSAANVDHGWNPYAVPSRTTWSNVSPAQTSVSDFQWTGNINVNQTLGNQYPFGAGPVYSYFTSTFYSDLVSGNRLLVTYQPYNGTITATQPYQLTNNKAYVVTRKKRKV